MSKEKKNTVSRRDFIKGATLTVGAGVLASCAPKIEETSAAPTAAIADQVVESSPAAIAGYSWETPPALIADADIKETIEADVVVVGSGLSGLSAAVRATEKGAKVVVLEKGETWTGRGGHFGAFESRYMREQGIENDKNEIARNWISMAGNRAKEDIVWLWLNNSGAAMDWFLDKAEAVGMVPVLLTSYYKGPTYTEYPGTHMFMPGENAKEGIQFGGAGVSQILYEEAVVSGVTFLFSSPAEQLVKDGDRVVGVIAKTADGYKKVNAAKGVILATGDIGGNEEMCKAYAPLALRANGSQYTPAGQNTGDGLKMGLWAGGTMQDTPFPTMIHPQAFSWLSYFFLYVNQQGNRYMNEDTWVQAKSVGAIFQPGEGPWAYSIFDSKWKEEVAASLPIGGGMFWDSMGRTLGVEWTPDNDANTIQGYIDEGKMGWTADTLDDLAAKIGVPSDAFNATVAHYNELATAQNDMDFGKRAELLTTIETAPFYALKFGGALLTVVGGLNVDTKLRVLDADSNPVPGLFAVGNVSGNLYGTDYPTTIPGNSHGRALTWGYLAGGNVTEA